MALGEEVSQRDHPSSFLAAFCQNLALSSGGTKILLLIPTNCQPSVSGASSH